MKVDAQRCVKSGFPGLCLVFILALMTPETAGQQGYAGLGQQAEGYADVRPKKVLKFPADHLAHPEYRIEWWYVTANLEDTEGRPMGLQWTLFRNALLPETGEEGWARAEFWMAHAAVTDGGRHRFAERFARGGIGQAGVKGSPFTAWLDNWEMQGTSGAGIDQLELSAEGDNFSYDISLVAKGPIVQHGENGFSQKSEKGQASYYYSQPFYQVTGDLVIDGEERSVTGEAWLDREWSSQPLDEGQSGWDWFSLHFDSGEKLMLFRLREGEQEGFTSGTWISEGGKTENLVNENIRFTPLERRKVAGRMIPVSWSIELPDRGVSIQTEALNKDAYMATLFPYWEGPVRIGGSHPGRGYLEMTGY